MRGLGVAAALYDAVRARVGEKRSNAAFFVVDQQNLRRGRKNLDDLADDPVRSNHAMIRRR